ncbi:hypothetical protein C8R44DRAFT_736066 [Mycena epipterygia]|nr:hypothetical protein C8R44DRAFT_736066 [Mycena epipterygia]
MARYVTSSVRKGCNISVEKGQKMGNGGRLDHVSKTDQAVVKHSFTVARLHSLVCNTTLGTEAAYTFFPVVSTHWNSHQNSFQHAVFHSSQECFMLSRHVLHHLFGFSCENNAHFFPILEWGLRPGGLTCYDALFHWERSCDFILKSWLIQTLYLPFSETSSYPDALRGGPFYALPSFARFHVKHRPSFLIQIGSSRKARKGAAILDVKAIDVPGLTPSSMMERIMGWLLDSSATGVSQAVGLLLAITGFVRYWEEFRAAFWASPHNFVSVAMKHLEAALRYTTAGGDPRASQFFLPVLVSADFFIPCLLEFPVEGGACFDGGPVASLVLPDLPVLLMSILPRKRCEVVGRENLWRFRRILSEFSPGQWSVHCLLSVDHAYLFDTLLLWLRGRFRVEKPDALDPEEDIRSAAVAYCGIQLAQQPFRTRIKPLYELLVTGNTFHLDQTPGPRVIEQLHLWLPSELRNGGHDCMALHRVLTSAVSPSSIPELLSINLTGHPWKRTRSCPAIIACHGPFHSAFYASLRKLMLTNIVFSSASDTCLNFVHLTTFCIGFFTIPARDTNPYFNCPALVSLGTQVQFGKNDFQRRADVTSTPLSSTPIGGEYTGGAERICEAFRTLLCLLTFSPFSERIGGIGFGNLNAPWPTPAFESADWRDRVRTSQVQPATRAFLQKVLEMDSGSSHISEFECRGAIVDLLRSDLDVQDNLTADVKNLVATVFAFQIANLTLGWSSGIKWPAFVGDPPPGDLSPVHQVMQSAITALSDLREFITKATQDMKTLSTMPPQPAIPKQEGSFHLLIQCVRDPRAYYVLGNFRCAALLLTWFYETSTLFPEKWNKEHVMHYYESVTRDSAEDNGGRELLEHLVGSTITRPLKWGTFVSPLLLLWNRSLQDQAVRPYVFWKQWCIQGSGRPPPIQEAEDLVWNTVRDIAQGTDARVAVESLLLRLGDVSFGVYSTWFRPTIDLDALQPMDDMDVNFPLAFTEVPLPQPSFAFPSFSPPFHGISMDVVADVDITQRESELRAEIRQRLEASAPLMPFKPASEAGTSSSARDTVATSHGSSLSSSAYPLHPQSPGGSTCMDSFTSLSRHVSVDRDPKANKRSAEDAQSTNFIKPNPPNFADIQTDGPQYGKVSSLASINPPHDGLADTETGKLKSKKRQNSAPEQEDSINPQHNDLANTETEKPKSKKRQKSALEQEDSVNPPHDDLADTETETPKSKKRQKSAPVQEDSGMLRRSARTPSKDKIPDYGGTAAPVAEKTKKDCAHSARCHCAVGVRHLPLCFLARKGFDSALKELMLKTHHVQDLKQAAFKERSDAIFAFHYWEWDAEECSIFQYRGHRESESAEYSLLASLQSVNDVNLRPFQLAATVTPCEPYPPPSHSKCFQNRLPNAPPSSSVTRINLEQWLNLVQNRTLQAVWGSGLHMWIEGMTLEQGFRRLPDFTDCIKNGTLNEFLIENDKPDKETRILNALDLPVNHIGIPNLLWGSSLDLELQAYIQTLGRRSTIPEHLPPFKDLSWSLIGLRHAFTYFHYDITATKFHVQTGRKLLLTGKPRAVEDLAKDGIDQRYGQLEDAFTMCAIDFTSANLDRYEYHCFVLDNSGTFIMQLGTPHLVIGVEPTIIQGGQFLDLSSVRMTIYTILHFFVLEQILTNTSHYALRETLVRVQLVWLDSIDRSRSTAHNKPPREEFLEYCPDIGTAKGLIDVLGLACMNALGLALDARTFTTETIPPLEQLQLKEVTNTFKNWRAWYANKYIVRLSDGKIADFDTDICSTFIYHLAVTMYRYRVREDALCTGREGFSSERLHTELVHALELYDTSGALAAKFSTDDDPAIHTRFSLFSDSDITIELKSP